MKNIIIKPNLTKISKASAEFLQFLQTQLITESSECVMCYVLRRRNILKNVYEIDSGGK